MKKVAIVLLALGCSQTEIEQECKKVSCTKIAFSKKAESFLLTDSSINTLQTIKKIEYGSKIRMNIEFFEKPSLKKGVNVKGANFWFLGGNQVVIENKYNGEITLNPFEGLNEKYSGIAFKCIGNGCIEHFFPKAAEFCSERDCFNTYVLTYGWNNLDSNNCSKLNIDAIYLSKNNGNYGSFSMNNFDQKTIKLPGIVSFENSRYFISRVQNGVGVKEGIEFENATVEISQVLKNRVVLRDNKVYLDGKLIEGVDCFVDFGNDLKNQILGMEIEYPKSMEDIEICTD